MIVWKKQGTNDTTVPGQTTRSWSSRDGKHTKVRVTRRSEGQKTASLISFKVDGQEIPLERRRTYALEL